MQSDNYHKLSEQEIQSELNRLQGWTIANGKLNRSFEFNSFIDAFSFYDKSGIGCREDESSSGVVQCLQ